MSISNFCHKTTFAFILLLIYHLYAGVMISPPVLESSLSYITFDTSVANKSSLIQSSRENLHILARRGIFI